MTDSIRNKTRVQIGVLFNDDEYTRLKDTTLEQAGQNLQSVIDREMELDAKLLDPLTKLATDILHKDYLIMITDRVEYDVVFEVPKKMARAFVEEAQKQFPDYSFIDTINPLADWRYLESHPKRP